MAEEDARRQCHHLAEEGCSRVWKPASA
jgi:hypothetical protein